MQREAFRTLAGTIAATALMIGTVASAADPATAPHKLGMVDSSTA